MMRPLGWPHLGWSVAAAALLAPGVVAAVACQEGVGWEAPDGGADGDVDGDVDADGDADLEGDGDALPDGDLGDPGDGGSGDGGLDADPPCDRPAGSACDPIVVDAFPFRWSGDTSVAADDLIDAYACAPDTDESGPEIHFELVVDAPGLLVAEVDEAPGVDVDIHLLEGSSAADCVARANTRLEGRLGAGRSRLVVDTYHAGADLAGPFTLDLSFEEAEAVPLGPMWNTYYYLAAEEDHDGAQDTPIYDASCAEIARVRREFHDSVCIEGSGILLDGRVINYASTCTSSCPAARTCGSRTYRVCYSVLDPEVYPWGMGAGSVALEPDRSIAVDPSFVPLGTVLYFEELDGVVPPGGSAPHDGCMRADDVGGAIDGNHFDFFAGTRSRWLAWEAIFPTGTELTAYRDHPRCFGL